MSLGGMALFVCLKMPYKTFPVAGGYKNWKVDEMGEKIGEPLSKEPLTQQQAEAQREALYASETKEATTTKMYGELKYTPAASFAELEAIEQAKEVEEMAEYFPVMVGNIMNRPDIEDKNEALRNLSVEFVGVVNDKIAAKEAKKEAKKEATKEEPQITKEEHYKAVTADDTLATDEDFQGGCPNCEFGEAELMKALEKCPYCWSEL